MRIKNSIEIAVTTVNMTFHFRPVKESRIRSKQTFRPSLMVTAPPM